MLFELETDFEWFKRLDTFSVDFGFYLNAILANELLEFALNNLHFFISSFCFRMISVPSTLVIEKRKEKIP